MRNSKKSGLTAGDIMSRDLVTVPLNATLAALALILQDNRITGAPVVDDAGHLVGVVSQSDLVRFGTRPSTAPHVGQRAFRSAEGEESDADYGHPYHTALDTEELIELHERFIEEDYGDALVSEIYTPFAVTVDRSAPVSELARLMVSKRVHRLIILDGKKAVGIVTSMDILKTLAGPSAGAKHASVLVAH
jgi:CBS domain-containing protein